MQSSSRINLNAFDSTFLDLFKCRSDNFHIQLNWRVLVKLMAHDVQYFERIFHAWRCHHHLMRSQWEMKLKLFHGCRSQNHLYAHNVRTYISYSHSHSLLNWIILFDWMGSWLTELHISFWKIKIPSHKRTPEPEARPFSTCINRAPLQMDDDLIWTDRCE